jgi:Legume lectin domain
MINLKTILFENKDIAEKIFYASFKEKDIKIEGTAYLKDGNIILTDDYHQNGKATVRSTIDLEDRSWKADIVFQIDGSEGVSDAEGKGADGISLIIGGEDKLVVNFDTYKNLENDSGNEIVLRVENAVVEKKYVRRKMNDGKKHHFRIHYNNPEQTIAVHEFISKETKAPILSYAFSEYPLSELLKGDLRISFSSFTGDAKAIHKILKFSIGYV